MPGYGQIKWKKVKKMLEVCAPGYSREDKKHRTWIRYRGLKAHLSLGEHGSRENVELELGSIKSMVRLFGIEECAKRELEQLR